MANYTESFMSVILPTSKVEDFKRLFIGNDDSDEERDTFNRTYLIDMVIDVQNKELTLLRIDFECAWSIYSCMLEDNEGYPTLYDVIEKFDIRKLAIYSKETGIGFEESVMFDKYEDDELQYDSRDLFYDPRVMYLEEERV